MSKILIESAPDSRLGGRREDGAYPVVLITPGQGTSGYYHEAVIQEYAPIAFPKNTHVYMDHLKEGESRSPERLLGTLVEETVVNDEGEATNWFKPLRKHAEWVEDVHSIVGLSVAVAGDGRKGEMNGKQTLIVESLAASPTNTVDIVSFAGRGGKFLESYIEDVIESTQTEPSGGTTKGTEPTMAIDEARLDAFLTAAEGLLAAKPAEPEAPSAAAAEADRASAVDAVVAIEAADISKELKAQLLEGVKAGDYNVAGKIEAEATLRESIRAELQAAILTEAGASTAGGKTLTEEYDVAGWGKK